MSRFHALGRLLSIRIVGSRFSSVGAKDPIDSDKIARVQSMVSSVSFPLANNGPRPSESIDLSIIVPTFTEHDNILGVVKAIDDARSSKCLILFARVKKAKVSSIR
jgi:hypothetical protein